MWTPFDRELNFLSFEIDRKYFSGFNFTLNGVASKYICFIFKIHLYPYVDHLASYFLL